MTAASRTALVTGASAGIGACFARQLAAQGYSLLLVARRVDRLEALAQELADAHGIECKVFAADLTDTSAPRDIMAYATEQNLTIDLLINNAGLSGHKKFVDTPWSELSGEIQVMHGKPVCVPGTFNKFSVAMMRPLPEWARYRIGKVANPFK